ncbi:HAMP domain-containing histidine kinase [Lampropedia puyangensis]|uniref:histidine kinase n=2 Tax=Lampropedia puyangensis TaxID=1330072 RepID=A0A4S8FAE2_9BURK|nr:HAMP domain-containing histidine kinase [Lampropedia puyangensis]
MKSTLQQMSLKTRITLTFVLLMATVMGFLVIAEQLDYDELRAYVASKNLRSEAAQVEAALIKGVPPPLSSGSQLYDAVTVPDALRHFLPGYHRITQPNGQYLQVFDVQDQRYYLLHASEGYVYLEFLIDGFAPFVILLCLLCAFWIGRHTSARVTTPIKRLAEAVAQKQKPFPFLNEQDEIGVLARAFAQHSEELEHFLHRERCFVGDASHELRTPLAIIGGAAETIAVQLPPNSPLIPSAERIVRTTQEMQRQLTCLLLLSRDPATLSVADMAWRPVIEECMHRCQPWLENKPVTLHVDVPHNAIVQTNAELARSVIWNLLRNACQYTSEGEVRVTVRDETLVISDTGPGLPASINPHQFERFSHSRALHGEGLGLSIVQRIVEHLGWEMSVDSSENGCCFTLQTRGNASAAR